MKISWRDVSIYICSWRTERPWWTQAFCHPPPSGTRGEHTSIPQPDTLIIRQWEAVQMDEKSWGLLWGKQKRIQRLQGVSQACSVLPAGRPTSNLSCLSASSFVLIGFGTVNSWVGCHAAKSTDPCFLDSIYILRLTELISLVPKENYPATRSSEIIFTKRQPKFRL